MPTKSSERNLFLFRDLHTDHLAEFAALAAKIDSPNFTPQQHPTVAIVSGNRTMGLKRLDMNVAVNPVPVSARKKLTIDTVGIGTGWLKNNRRAMWVELDPKNSIYVEEQRFYREKIGKLLGRTINPQKPHATLGYFESEADTEMYAELLADSLMPQLTLAPIRTFPEGIMEAERQKPPTNFLTSLRQGLPPSGGAE